MALVEHYYTKFEEECFYHIYNRSVDKKPMFKSDGNYEYFLKKYDAYLSPVLDTYSYCLLGNHFHLLVRIKSLTDLTTFQKLSNQTKPKSTHDTISHQFRKLFQCYAMAFNKQHSRVGTLFQTPFKRALVDNAAYFTRLIYYIHANPQMHNLTSDFKEWRWSSYQRLLLENKTKLMKKEVLEWFGTKQQFEEYHLQNQQISNEPKIFLDEI
jgi:REP element-mobilizing transposase RayT